MRIWFPTVIQYEDQVDDMEIRFGQGRRGYLVIEYTKRIQSVHLVRRSRTGNFLQSTPILASLWNGQNYRRISSPGWYKTTIKVWKKGEVSTYDLPFQPIYARFIDIEQHSYLLAIDSKSTL
jgi:hypothetical protein